MLALLFNKQVVFNGLVQGRLYGLRGMAVVLIHRSSKVINFAAGNMGLLGTVLFMILSLNWNVPYWLALALGLAAGIAFGAILELIVVRRLFKAPRIILLVATIGMAQYGMRRPPCRAAIDGRTRVGRGRRRSPADQPDQELHLHEQPRLTPRHEPRQPRAHPHCEQVHPDHGRELQHRVPQQVTRQRPRDQLVDQPAGRNALATQVGSVRSKADSMSMMISIREE